MSYEHCDKHDTDATNDCEECELEDPSELRDAMGKMNAAYERLRKDRNNLKAQNDDLLKAVKDWSDCATSNHGNLKNLLKASGKAWDVWQQNCSRVFEALGNDNPRANAIDAAMLELFDAMQEALG